MRLMILIAGMLSLPLIAQKAFTVAEAQIYALENNLDYQNSSLDIKIAKKKVWETTATGLPQLNGEFNFNHFMDIAGMPFPNPLTGEMGFVQMGLENSVDFGLTASQLVFNGSYFIGLKAATEYVKMTEKQQELKAADIKENVSTAYYMVLAAQLNLSIVQENLVAMKKLQTETKALNEEGMTEKLEVDQMDLNVSNLTASKDMAVQALNNATMLLNFHLGLDPKTLLELKDDLESVMTNIDPNVAEKAFSATSHIDYQILTTKEKLDLLNWRNEQAKALPTISAFYNNKQTRYGSDLDFPEMDLYNQQFDKNWIPQQLVGVKVSMPIFTSLQGSARMSQAKMELAKTKNAVVITEKSLKMQADIAKSDYINAISSYNNSKGNVDLTKGIYDRTLIKYKEGMVSSFELNQSKQQQLQAEGQRIQSIINVLNKKIALDKAYSNL